MAHKAACVALLALISLLSCGAVLPGFKATISQNGLDYAREIGVQYLMQKLSTITIPDQSGSASAPVVGGIDWQLTNIVMTGLSLPSSSIVINPGSGITISISGATVDMSMNFNWKEHNWPHASGSGSVTIDASSIAVSVAMSISASNGRPVLSVISDSVNIGNLDISVHGGASWLYQFFVDVLKNQIKNAAQNALTNAITTEIDQGANAALATIPITQQLGSDALVDFSMVSGPTFGSGYLTLNQKGEFYALNNPQEAPFTPTQLPDTVSSQMLQVFFSSYVADTASYVFFKLGKMVAVLHDSDLPSWSPIRLNTNSWKFFIPQLYSKYPNMPMQAAIQPIQSPTATFATSGLAAVGIGEIVVSVIFPNNTAVPVFTLGLNVTTSGKAILIDNGQTLTGNLTYLNSSISLMSSQVGTFDVSLLSIIIKTLAEDGIVPFFNYYLSHGVAIPNIKGVTFNNPTLGYGDGYIYVSTDVTYT